MREQYEEAVAATELHELRCFSEEPHRPHRWTFYYNDPPTNHRCPGVGSTTEGDN